MYFNQSNPTQGMPPNVRPSLTHQQTSILTTDASLSDGRVSPPSQPYSEEETSQQLFFVTSYSDFDKLAHGPRGHVAKHTLRVYGFDPSGSSLVLLHVAGEGSAVINPAFSRFHPRLNVVYTCTEDIEENGQILAYQIHSDGSLTLLGSVDAGGTSTCYLTIDREQRNLIAVNYWDSSLAVIPLSREDGTFLGGIKNIYDPRGGQAMRAAAKKFGGVNHSNNDESTIAQRQVDPHSHALVLDPFEGCVAYVPDLGKDLIREFWYDKEGSRIACELNVLPSGLSTGKPDGPRYFEFHPRFNVAYVVNELSSTVAVFRVDRELLSEIAHASKNKQPMERFKGRSTLKLIQSIKTVPSAFPTEMNTCGRMCVHPSGRFVVVSNRGHESIAIFKVKQCNSAGGKAMKGTLAQVGFFHTRGETPRHFQFDASGQILIVANQDSDTIAVFTFNLTTGAIQFSGNEYRVPSPNFVCSCPMVDRYSDDEDNDVPMAVGNGNILHNTGSVPSSVEFDSSRKSSVDHELQLARKEIEVLKRQIAMLTPVTSPESTLTSDAARDLKDLFVDRNNLGKLEEA
jgi:6-phosphogluconolactonase (cycloisomerase 2 family)